MARVNHGRIIRGGTAGKQSHSQQFSFCGARLCANHQPQRVETALGFWICGGWSCGHSRAPDQHEKCRLIPPVGGARMWTPAAGPRALRQHGPETRRRTSPPPSSDPAANHQSQSPQVDAEPHHNPTICRPGRKSPPLPKLQTAARVNNHRHFSPSGRKLARQRGNEKADPQWIGFLEMDGGQLCLTIP
jgi:hypothetical protein